MVICKIFCSLTDSLALFFHVRDDSEFNDESFDACRIYGGIDVNKVAGNFHITAGK